MLLFIKNLLIGPGVLISGLIITLILIWQFLLRYDQKITLSEHPVDQAGSIILHTHEWQVSTPETESKNRVTFDFIVGEHGIQKRGGIKICLGHVMNINGGRKIYTPFSLTVPSALFFGTHLLKDAHASTNHSDARLKIDETSPAVAFLDVVKYIKYKRSKQGRESKDNLLRQVDNEYSLDVTLTRSALEYGDTIRVTLGAEHGLVAPERETEWQVIVRIDGDGDGTYGLLGKLPTIKVISREVAGVKLIAPSFLFAGESDSLLCRVEDGYFLSNLSHFQTGILDLNPMDGIEIPGSVQNSGRNGGLLTFPVTARQPGIYRITGEAFINGELFPVQSNPVKVVSPPAEQVYFGDIHSHSIMSYDADRPPEYVYWRHRYREGYDFAALSDRDMIGAVPFADKNSVQGRTPEEWGYLKSIANSYNAPEVFVTLLAYEWTSYEYGHRNVYFSAEQNNPPLFYHNRENRALPGQLQDELHSHSEKYITIPHSTAWRTPNVVYRWGPKDWVEQRQLEIYSAHGAPEYFDNEYAVDKGHSEIPSESKIIKNLMNYNIRQAPPQSGNFAQDALADGWRFGFLGASDMHYLSYLDQAYQPGIMAVYSSELTRKGIWEAMNQRRTYATTCARMLVDFRLNGHPMGSNVPINDNQSKIQLSGEFHGTGSLDKITIIKYDGEQYSQLYEYSPNENILDYNFSVEDYSATTGGFYYLRIRQKDGNTAWTSPIWLESE